MNTATWTCPLCSTENGPSISRCKSCMTLRDSSIHERVDSTDAAADVHTRGFAMSAQGGDGGAAARDSAPWLVRNWWIPSGVVLGLLIGAWQAGLFDPEGPQPGQNPSGALVIGVGICWAIDRMLVKPRRLAANPTIGVHTNSGDVGASVAASQDESPSVMDVQDEADAADALPAGLTREPRDATHAPGRQGISIPLPGTPDGAHNPRSAAHDVPDDVKFCPLCGARRISRGEYCVSCGVPFPSTTGDGTAL